MKKSIITVYLMILSLGVSSAFAAAPGKKNKPDEANATAKSEYKMTEEDYDRITRRVEEIRDFDKSELTSAEKSALKKELKEMKAMVKADGGYIYIGAGTLLVIILLVILLL